MNNLPLFAALDIGSNAARILFANVIKTETDFLVFKNSLLRLPLRLGTDVYEKGVISPKKVRALMETVRVFQSLISINKPEEHALYATAAIREAKNANQILGMIKAETGMIINVIDGLEEARLIKELYCNQGDVGKYKLLADLGGGSFELTVLSPNGDFVSDSFKIGAVRTLSSGISEVELERMFEWLQNYLPKDLSMLNFIGTGGNINSLKKTFSNPLTDYISHQTLNDLLVKLEPVSFIERITQYKLRPDRADVIIPAIKIFLSVMDKFDIDKVLVPGGGLSDGIILHLYKTKYGNF